MRRSLNGSPHEKETTHIPVGHGRWLWYRCGSIPSVRKTFQKKSPSQKVAFRTARWPSSVQTIINGLFCSKSFDPQEIVSELLISCCTVMFSWFCRKYSSTTGTNEKCDTATTRCENKVIARDPCTCWSLSRGDILRRRNVDGLSKKNCESPRSS